MDSNEEPLTALLINVLAHLKAGNFSSRAGKLIVAEQENLEAQKRYDAPLVLHFW